MIYIVRDNRIKVRALTHLEELPYPYRIKIQEGEGRNLDQNAKFHAICSDLAKSDLTWAGRRRDADEWKALLVSGHAVATKAGGEVVPGLEGEFVSIRESTSQMNKTRASSLIEYAVAFCAAHGIEA